MQVWQAVKERLNGQSRSVGIARGWSSMPMAWRHLKLRSVRRALENAGKASNSLLVRPVRQKMKAIEMAFVCAETAEVNLTTVDHRRRVAWPHTISHTIVGTRIIKCS